MLSSEHSSCCPFRLCPSGSSISFWRCHDRMTSSARRVTGISIRSWRCAAGPPAAWVTKFLRERAARHARLGHEYDAVPHSTPLHHFVDLDKPDTVVFADVFRLVEPEAVRPEWLVHLDPARTAFVPLIEGAIDRARSDWRELARAAEWTACYAENSPEWRRIAVRAVAAAAEYPTDQRQHIYWQLTDHGGAYCGTVGEVAPRWVEDLATAERRLGEEEDASLRDYWRWKVAAARADLAREQQGIEERG